MTSTLREGVIGRRGWGLASVLDVIFFYFLLKKIGFAPWPDIMLNQTLIYYWQEIFLLTPSFNDTIEFFVAKSNKITRGQWRAWFCFCFNFVWSYARCSCCSKVYVFKLWKWNRLIAKWVLKMWRIINKRHFVILLDNCTHNSINPQNEKKSKESQARLISWYWQKQSPRGVL